jgi:acyl-CoA reductase-like NAD-dependent aldehyde dehydrogenase
VLIQTVPTVPYGGFKLSGPGKMLGAAYVEEMTQVKAVWMKVGA